MDGFDFIPPRPVSGISFRLAHTADGEGLYTACYMEQANAVFAQMFSRSLRRQENGQGYHLLAFEQDVVVGTAQLIRRGRRGEIADVVVTAACQGQGIGTALIELLERIAAVRKWRPVEIGVTVGNVRARALYERLGYELVKEITLSEGENAFILHKW